VSTRPNVFSIPPSAPFLPTLAAALLDGKLIPGFSPRGDPLALASATVYLPTRRAARAFGEALLEALGTEATLLPRVVPLGDADEDALAFAESDAQPERPAPISITGRRLVLASLVQRFAEAKRESGEASIASSPAASLQLADALARLFDDMTIAGVGFDALGDADFVPAEHDRHWQDSLTFLKLVRPAWESYLVERSLVDPTAWRDRLLARERERLKLTNAPTIAAGSTGTIPAVGELIAAIARLPNGAVVLPGLDQALDERSFALISGSDTVDPSSGHPQFGLKRLIERIGIAREAVTALGTPLAEDRERLLSEAFRPAATSDLWQERDRFAAAQALDSVTIIEATDLREEALAIAVSLRETLERPGAQAALITPDRALARRVAAELRRWDIAIDDSAGIALADSEAGRFARLTATVAAERLAPIPLLALLRHPLHLRRGDIRSIDALEIAVLRGPRPAAGADGLLRALGEAHELARKKELHRRDARMKLGDADWERAFELARFVGAALAPLLDLHRERSVPLAKLLQAHREALTQLGVDLTRAEAERSGREGLYELASAFQRFDEAAKDTAALSLTAYADAFAPLLSGEPPVRPPLDRNARIRILGPLEARLLENDRVVLGGLNEGIWPPETHADAWLNRPMRRKLGLDLPERRIGLAAHDFAQAMGARELLLTRARKATGVEMVASRFLQRLSAVAPETAWQAARQRGARYLDLARVLELPGNPQPVKRPTPTPPVAARPKQLSVTEIETLIRDPYSIYARHVLRLDPLDEIDADPGAAERGTVIHEALAAFTKHHPDSLPADALERLLASGEHAFAELKDFPGLTATWWPRFVRAARWFIGNEGERRPEIERLHSEIGGALQFDAGGRPFRLTARADRIEQRRDGGITIVDYKTGEPPTLRQALIGLAPQLPLEAAIAQAGGFKDVPQGRIEDILVVRLSGGEPPGKVVSHNPVNAKGDAAKVAKARNIASAEDLAAYARRQLVALITAYAKPETPYHSIPRPQWRGRFGEYDHLARIREWSANEGEEEW
jgi:ATP-dependent helicase/nuclease subunit B